MRSPTITRPQWVPFETTPGETEKPTPGPPRLSSCVEFVRPPSSSGPPSSWSWVSAVAARSDKRDSALIALVSRGIQYPLSA